MTTPSVILLNGSVGAGKTTVAARMGELLAERKVPSAVVDLDELRQAWPAPADDPFNLSLTLANLAAITPNFRAVGCERLVLAGVVESRSEVARYAAAVGDPDLRVVWLRADVSTLRERVHRRGRDFGAALDWHLHRTAELDAVIAAAGVTDVEIGTDEQNLDGVARTVLHHVGWAGADGSERNAGRR